MKNVADKEVVFNDQKVSNVAIIEINCRYTNLYSALGRVMAYPYLALRPIRNELVSQQCWQVARIPCL